MSQLAASTASTRAGIENTLSRYAWAYDNDDIGSMWRCYTTDVEVEFGDVGVKRGREAVLEEMDRRRNAYRVDDAIPWHIISNVFVRDDVGSTALVKSSWMFLKQDASGAQEFKGVGFYDDEFALEDGEWRIHRRKVRKAGQT